MIHPFLTFFFFCVFTFRFRFTFYFILHLSFVFALLGPKSVKHNQKIVPKNQHTMSTVQSRSMKERKGIKKNDARVRTIWIPLFKFIRLLALAERNRIIVDCPNSCSYTIQLNLYESHKMQRVPAGTAGTPTIFTNNIHHAHNSHGQPTIRK